MSTLTPEIVGDVRIAHPSPQKFAANLLMANVVCSDQLRAAHPELSTALDDYRLDDPPLVFDPYSLRHCTPAEVAHFVVNTESVVAEYRRNPHLVFIHERAEVEALYGTNRINDTGRRWYGTTVCEGDSLTTTPIRNGQRWRQGLHADLGEDYEWRIGWNHGDPERAEYQGDRSLTVLTSSIVEIGRLAGTEITDNEQLRGAFRTKPDVLRGVKCLLAPVLYGEAYLACTGLQGVCHDASTFDLESLSRLEDGRRKAGSVISFLQTEQLAQR